MKTFFILPLLLFSSAVWAQTSIGSQRATLVDGKVSSYPGRELRKGNAGLVEMLFIVDENGAVIEPMVLRSTARDFEQAALSSVAKFRYSPAMLNGAPVKGSATYQISYFVEDAKDQVTRTFARQHKTALNYLAEENPKQKKIRKHLDKMRASSKLGHYSWSYIQSLEFDYARKFGTIDEQIQAIENLLLYQNNVRDEEEVLTEAQIVGALQNLLKLQLQVGRYASSLRTFDKLVEAHPAAEQAYSSVMSQVMEVRTSDKVYQTPITISDRGYASINLYKSKFSFANVVGDFSDLKLRCVRHYKELGFSATEQFELKPSWGSCHLQIMGEEGSTVDLVQF